MLKAGGRTWDTRLVVAIVMVAGFAIFLLRRPTGILDPYIWAEDGRIFWAQALTTDISLFEPYAGQGWMTQRLLAAGISVLPATLAGPLFYPVACGVAVASVAVVLQTRCRSLFGRFRYQVLVFLMVLLVPIAFEAQGNWANIQIWMGVALLVIFAAPSPGATWSKGLELAYVALAGLTGFLGVLTAPLAIWAAVRDRSLYVIARSAVLLGAAGVNLVIWRSQDRPPAPQTMERLLTIPTAMIKRVGGGALFGEYPSRVLWPLGAFSIWAIAAAAFLLVVVYLTWVDRRGPSPIWLFTGILWGILGVVSPTGASAPDWVYDVGGGWRYFVLAVIACFMILVRALSQMQTRTWAAVGIVACLPAIAVGAYLRPVDPPLDRGQVVAFQECLDSEAAACALPIAPAGWVVDVPLGPPGSTIRR